jgi:hypothetical protein
MTQSTSGPRVSRESRLLLATVAVCALALVVLARMRFPQQTPATETVVTAPLERLAARASYDALAADIQRVEPMIASRLVGLRVTAALPAVPRTLSDALAASRGRSAPGQVAALRVTADTAIAVIAPGIRIDGLVGDPSDTSVSVLAVDPVRHIARVSVPGAPLRELRQVPLASVATPAYVVAVEATQAGVTLRPVFLGRGDRFTSSRWGRPLLPLGGIAVAAGALMFTLDGGFIGVVVTENGSPAVASATDLLETGERLAAGASHPADLGLALQRLTPELRAALGVEHGVVVAEVAAASPAAAVLAPTDVILGVDGWSTDDPDQMLLRLGTTGAGTLSVVRAGQRRAVTVASMVDRADGDQGEARKPSRAFSFERGVGTRIAERQGSTPPPGLAAGDLIIQAGTFSAPTPAEVQQVLGQGHGFATFVVRRDGTQRVVAVPVAEQANDVR